MHVEIRRQGLELSEWHKLFLTEKMRGALKHFRNRVHRVVTFMSDVNGPKGGVNKRCRVLVHLKSQGVVVVQHTGESILAAIGGAFDRLGQAIHRRVLRKRTEHRQRSRRWQVSLESACG